MRDTVEFLVEQCVDMGVLPCPRGARGAAGSRRWSREGRADDAGGGTSPVISIPQQPEEQWAQRKPPCASRRTRHPWVFPDVARRISSVQWVP